MKQIVNITGHYNQLSVLMKEWIYASLIIKAYLNVKGMYSGGGEVTGIGE